MTHIMSSTRSIRHNEEASGGVTGNICGHPSKHTEMIKVILTSKFSKEFAMSPVRNMACSPGSEL